MDNVLNKENLPVRLSCLLLVVFIFVAKYRWLRCKLLQEPHAKSPSDGIMIFTREIRENFGNKLDGSTRLDLMKPYCNVFHILHSTDLI